jgi:hypothetical protein
VRPNQATAALLFFCLVSSSPAQARFPGREIAKSQAEVRDSFLSYFIGLVDANCTGYADGAFLHAILPEFVSFYSLPFEQILQVRREAADGGALVTVDFAQGLTLPIPFRVLWDTPGTITATPTIAFRETRLSAAIVADGAQELRLSPFYVFDSSAGRFSIDFDPWIDVLLGRAVDDVDITRVLLFSFDGTWYGALMGKGYDGQLVAGYFDFKENRILVPVPRRFRDIGVEYGPR